MLAIDYFIELGLKRFKKKKYNLFAKLKKQALTRRLIVGCFLKGGGSSLGGEFLCFRKIKVGTCLPT
jgi:hypothetical protein